MKNRKNIAVIGGGAAGMTAAISAAKAGAKVTIYEKNDRVGKKLLATGNGKCNLGNLFFDMEQYYCEDKHKLNNIFRQFTVEDTQKWFEGLGLLLRERNGYLYPYSEQASTVLDILRIQLNNLNIPVITQTEVKELHYDREHDIFTIRRTDGQRDTYQSVVLACGSPASLKKGEGISGYRIASGFGHHIRKVVPGLVQLKSEDGFLRALAGVRCQAAVQLTEGERLLAWDSGELQFTDYGISGIPVFQISRIAAYAIWEKKKVQVAVDFFPNWEKEDYEQLIHNRYIAQKQETMEQFLTGLANKKINMMMLRRAGLKPEMTAEQAGYDKIQSLLQEYRKFIIKISGVNPFEKAQICAGGIDFSEVSDRLESKLVKGLFLAGEMLDIDGKCGGYNLQWAWTSGMVAGLGAAGGSREKC